jgi:ABC-type uncharacterized transport system involved in gliding motility auxiliary subunit
MHDLNDQRKRFRGSSPQEEMKQEFDNWTRSLRSIEQPPEGSLTPSVKADQRKEQTMASTERASGGSQQSDDEGRWQDDGGDGG